MRLPVSLNPLSGLRKSTEASWQWLATNDDPQFSLHGWERGRGAWLRIEVRLRSDQAKLSQLALYLDRGTGYSEKDAVILHPVGGVARALFYMAPETRALRFDPQAQPCSFAIDQLVVITVSRPELLVRTGGSLLYRRRSDLPRVLRSGFGVIRRHGLKHLKAALLTSSNRPPKQSHEYDYERWRSLRELPVAAHTLAAVVESGPLISIVMPTYNTPAALLAKAICSVKAQSYGKWELCIADDCSPKSHVRRLLTQYAAEDDRIRFVVRERNGHISAATNSALALASGAYVAFLDHDDELHPDALYHVAEAILANPSAGLLYSDEDKTNELGERSSPYFKCQFNYELMLAQNMICHLAVYRKDLLDEIGGPREGFEGAQDHDLALRAIERLAPAQIHHIPHVLYHWRAIEGSTALAAGEKNYAAEASRRAVAEHLQRVGKDAIVVPAPEAPAMNRVIFARVEPQPLVSILIPTRDRAALLGMCLDSLLSRTSYSNYEIIIIDNGSVDPETFALFERLPKDRVSVIRDDSSFNFSRVNNLAARRARGAYLCLMNNDIEIVTSDWLEEMLSFAAQSEIGCVGARLWYPDGRLQHGGVILGIGGIAGHAHKYLSKGMPGYFGRAVLHQSFSAVTAACLLISRDKYEQVDGLDEDLAVAFNDVDFCLRVRNSGYRNVWTPYAEMVHHESASRGAEDTPEKQVRFRAEVARMLNRWGHVLKEDPAYSRNLSSVHEDFSLQS